MGVTSGKNGNATERKGQPFGKRLGSMLRAMDAWRLLISLVLAIVFYVMISDSSKNSKYSAWRTIEVPVKITSEDSNGIIYLQDQIHKVEVEFSVDLLHYAVSYEPEAFNFKIDFNRLLAAMGEYPPTLKNTEPLQIPYAFSSTDVKKKPAGVEIRGIRNGEKKILCDRVQRRQVPVVVDSRTTQNYSSWTFEYVPTPTVVTISGPAFEVNRIEKISTASISPDKTVQYTESVDLELPQALSSVLTLDQKKVECLIKPKRNGMEEVSRAFNNLRVSFLTRLDSQLYPKVSGGEMATLVNVHLKGMGKILDTISPEQLRVVCDLTPYTLAGGQHVKLSVTGLPDGVSVKDIEPKELLVELVHKSVEVPEAKEVVPAEEVKKDE